jgi:cytosine/adenosine deaminase-related metal-dependent hydrolase
MYKSMHQLILVLLLAIPLTTGANPVSAARWVVLIQGNPAGFMEIETPVPGELQCHFEFNDRGRGPNLDTRIVLGEDGLPREIDTTGNDYMKAPVDESFTWKEGTARWKNSQEEGERLLEEPALFLSRESACPEMGILATALLGAPDQRLDLLPDGEARLEIVGETTFTSGAEEKTLRQASLTGLGFSPSFLWLDEDDSFFAATSSWFWFLPEGWESIGEKMAQIDDAANTEWTAGLVGRLAHRPTDGVAFKNARVWDATREEPVSGQTVLVLGDSIRAIGEDGTVELPEGVETIDAGGKLLMPGLWDMHTHVGDLDGILNLAAGVTTVRDMANDIDKALALRLAWQEGTAVGPRLILSGFIDGPGPYAGPTKILVDTEEEARVAIDRYGDLGFEQIKIYSSVLPELVPYMAERAHHRGMRVSGHIPNGMTAEQAIKDGFDEIQHANMLFLTFWGDEGIDTRTPARFTEVAKRAADFDFEAPETLAFFEFLREKAIVVDPTIAIFEGMFTARPGIVPVTWKPIIHRLPPQVRRGMMGGGLEPPAGEEERYERSFKAMIRMVGEVHRAGIPVVAGTDTLAGFGLHRELELYVEAGITPAEVLALATLGSAKIAGRAERLGTIEAGKLADFILVDGDPLSDMSDIRNVTLTVKDGTIFRPADMYQAIGVGQ